jgi:polyisoprenoid-binding protein YceI
MKKTLSVVLGVAASVMALGVVAAVAVPIVYRDVVAAPTAGPPDVRPTVYQRTPSAVVQNGPDLSGTWVVADGSIAGYRIAATVDGNPVSMDAHTNAVSGRFTVEGQSLTSASVSIDLSSAIPDDSDDTLSNDVLETDRYPFATFVLTSPVDPPTTPTAAGSSQIVHATGDFTLHGVTKSVTVQLKVGLSGKGMEVSGSVPVDFADYGVEVPTEDAAEGSAADDSGAVDFQLSIVAD